jgi:uncharacterized protein involved in exopolysaccharide biosynthesis
MNAAQQQARDSLSEEMRKVRDQSNVARQLNELFRVEEQIEDN